MRGHHMALEFFSNVPTMTTIDCILFIYFGIFADKVIIIYTIYVQVN